MRQVGVAKRAGNGMVMFPLGATSVEDLPCDLSLALDHAYTILNWQENLLYEELPPKWMWHLDWELEDWFEELKRVREQKYGGGGDEEAPMMRNEDPELKTRFGR